MCAGTDPRMSPGPATGTASALRLQLDEHGARVAPVRHRVGVGVLRGRVSRPVGRVHYCEHVVGHQRDDRHLAYGNLHILAAELQALWIVEANLADVLDDLVELRVRPALPVAWRLR